MFTCTVCGYNKLNRPPVDWLICPCCRTQFGYSDVGRDLQTLRAEWIHNGALWGSKRLDAPAGWNPYFQLMDNLNYVPSREEKKLLLAAHPIEDMPPPFRSKQGYEIPISEGKVTGPNYLPRGQSRATFASVCAMP